MGRAKAVAEVALLALLSAGLGHTLGLFSAAGVPEGAMAGKPLEKAGGGIFIAAGLAAFTCAWYVPRWFLVWPFAFGAGFVALVAHRVELHAPDAGSPYLVATALSAAGLAGAMIGSIAGALGSQIFGGSKIAPRSEHVVARAGRFLAVAQSVALAGIATIFIVAYFMDPHKPLPAVIAGVAALLVIGTVAYLVSRPRRSDGDEETAPTSEPGGLAKTGKWLVIAGVATPFILLPFANPRDLSLPALLSAVLTPLLFFGGLIVWLIGHLKQRDSKREDDA